jgi:chromosome segregation ATPase
MDEIQDWELEAEKFIEETLGSLEATVDQLETLTQMSEELEESLEEMRSWLDQVNLFLSDRFRVALIAATIIVAAALVGYVRGWWQARRIGL